MAEIGYGYGSEWQLLRFLGRHRCKFEDNIKEAIKKTLGIEFKECFQWLDFEFSKNPSESITGDVELKGLSFLEKILPPTTYKKIDLEYRETKINNLDTWQNWDAVFKLGNTIFFVEAKAHKGELKSESKEHGGKSHDNIYRFFEDQMKAKGINPNSKWMEQYYQFANRLSTIAMLKKHLNPEFDARLLYVFFVNGYHKKIVSNRKINTVDKKNNSRNDFEEAIMLEQDELGLKEMDLKEYVVDMFIDAETGNLVV